MNRSLKSVVQTGLKKVQEGQRSAFFTLLRTHDLLIPEDPEVAQASVDALGRPKGTGLEVAKRVKAEAADEADSLISQYSDSPLIAGDCQRAQAHLQMAALAVGAKRALLREAARPEYGYAGEDELKARSVVAGAIGVVAPADGSTPYGAPVMWIPNRTTIALSWDKAKTLRGMVGNFETDLGASFALEPLEPAPSCRLTRCLYTSFLRAEGEPHLMPLFWALHEATFKGVPGYEFEPPQHAGEGEDGCVFRFRS